MTQSRYGFLWALTCRNFASLPDLIFPDQIVQPLRKFLWNSLFSVSAWWMPSRPSSFLTAENVWPTSTCLCKVLHHKFSMVSFDSVSIWRLLSHGDFLKMHEFSKIYSHFETRNSVGGYRHESSSVYVYYRTDDSTGFQKFIELGARKVNKIYGTICLSATCNFSFCDRVLHGRDAEYWWTVL